MPPGRPRGAAAAKERIIRSPKPKRGRDRGKEGREDGDYQLAAHGCSLAADSGKLDGKYLQAKAEHLDLTGEFLAEEATKFPPQKRVSRLDFCFCLLRESCAAAGPPAWDRCRERAYYP
jgi:hypothetical protein